MASACLTLYETTFELRWFEEAVTLADELIRLFRDDERGGFFQTGSDAEELVLRPKELYDNATPSGNSVAAEVLLRLALFTGDAAYEHAGVSALRLIRDAMAGAPTGFGQALCALDLYVGPSNEVAIIGDPSSRRTPARCRRGDGLRSTARTWSWPSPLRATSAPRSTVPLAARPRRASTARRRRTSVERFTCKLPTTDAAALRAQLDG